MTTQQSTPWRTSSYSGSNGGECVEVAHAPADIGVRDSKHRTAGTLAVTAEAWAGLATTVADRAA